MSGLRILQIMNRVPWPLKDGGALGFFNYVKGYHEARCEVTVCAINTNKHWVEMEKLPADVKQLADWKTITLNTDVRPLDAFLNLFGSDSYNIQRFVSPAFENLLIQILKTKSFDVIVFEGLFVSPYIHAVRKHSKAPCILRQHNVEYQIWETLAKNEKQPIKAWYLQLLAKRMKKAEHNAIRLFDGLTTVTQQDADVFKAMGCKSPIFVSPFGIDLGRLSPNHTAIEKASVFHLGSMEWLPNRQAMEWFLEEVWPTVNRSVPEAIFYLAGRGMPESFKHYASASVVIVGEVEDAIEFMQQKEIMIVPLFAGSGIRVKILEGLALGKEIVSTPLGAQGIACEDGKHLLLASDKDTFAAQLIRLLRNPEEAAKLRLEANQLAISVYDNTKIIHRVLQFYKSLITAA
jgi:glycosyltransferase involved in cell wall biosynthesis